MKQSNHKKKLFSLLILISLFLLNDFVFIPIRDALTWLLVDYLSRILALTIMVYLIRQNISDLDEFGLVKISIKQGVKWSIILSVAGIMIDQIGWRFFEKILPRTQLMSYPVVKDIYLNIFDLTIGLVLVSITEELIFRGYFPSVLNDYFKRPFIMVSLSSIVFGLIHWSLGLHVIISTAIWGVLPMIIMLRTGSIIPALIAHYLTDLIAFSHLIPDRWVSFLG